jgi:hypothetical protein
MTYRAVYTGPDVLAQRNMRHASVTVRSVLAETCAVRHSCAEAARIPSIAVLCPLEEVESWLSGTFPHMRSGVLTGAQPRRAHHEPRANESRLLNVLKQQGRVLETPAEASLACFYIMRKTSQVAQPQLVQ